MYDVHGEVRIVLHSEKLNGYEPYDLRANHDMQITGVMVLVGLSFILFEVFPEESVWSIPVRQGDEHMVAVPASGGFSLLLGQQEAYKTLIKEQQRFWKRILIEDDDADLITTFKAVIEESNYNNDVNKICQ